MSFYEPASPLNINKHFSHMHKSIQQKRHKVTSSLIIILLLASLILVTIPVSNVVAQLDRAEYFVPVPYVQRIDDDMDGYFETARIHYDVDTYAPYAEIRVVCSVFDNDTEKLVKQMSDTYMIFRSVDFKDTYFDFRTSYTGKFNFSLAVYDEIHHKKEHGGNDYPVDNVSLEVNPYKYRIIADATALDADGDGYNDDVRIKVTDTLNYTISNASVYLDGEFEGKTDLSGMFLKFNLPRGIHEVDAFYRSLHANTDFKSEGTGQQLTTIYADADPFDEDFDGYIDDVVIRAYGYNYYPLPNTEVYIDWYYYGNTDQQGLLYAYDFENGFHNVDITTRNYWTETTFYAEALNVTDINEYFYWVEGSIVALDNDGLANDLDIYLDVDIDDGYTSNVTVNATVYYENRTVAATGSTNYTTIGYEVEDEHIYIYNLTSNMTYNLMCELFDDHGNLEDVWYQEGLVVQVSYGVINVDKFVQDLHNDNHLNDVIFTAHIKDEGYTFANIKVYWENNDTLAYNITTSNEGGYAVIENLLYKNYTWTAYDKSNNLIYNCTFELYDRNTLRNVQILVRLFDRDRDNYFDDFEVSAYDERRALDNNVSVKIVDFRTNQTVAQGFTSAVSQGGTGTFLVEDLPEGFYKYKASIDFGFITPEVYQLSTGWFYSYGNSTESTHNLNAFAIAIDMDNDGYQNDVRVLVTDRNNQPVMNAIVFFDNDYQNRNTTDQNGIVYAKDFERGWHDVDVLYLGDSPMVPRNAHAYTRFYSEGMNYDEYFWFIFANVYDADNDDEWNDLNVSMDVDVDEEVEVEVTVEIEIHYESNGTLAAYEEIKFMIFSYYWVIHYIDIHDLPYNEKYYANYTLKDDIGNIEDQWNQTNIFIIPITPMVNIDLELYNYSYYDEANEEGNIAPCCVLFWAHILNKGIENISIEIYYKSNDTMVDKLITDEYGYANIIDLGDADYYFIAKNNTNHFVEYGEFNIGNHIAWIWEFQYDTDDDGYYDDFGYYAYKVNYTYEQDPLGGYIVSVWTMTINLSVIIYDLQDNIIAQGDTSDRAYFIYNFTEGYYKFKASYETQRVTNGSFFSYGNGFKNQPPEAIISAPEDSSVWNTTDNILFDGGNSNDPDTSDIITFYWESNITGPLGFSDSFIRKLPKGIHQITLYVDDGHGHNVTDSVTISVFAPTSANQPPIADAGEPQNNVPVNTEVTLDGSGSYDPDGSIDEFDWNLDSTDPPGLTASLDDSSAEKPKFTPTKIGKYTWSLQVKDNNDTWSGHDFVNITVIENQVPIVNISLPKDMAKFNSTDTIFFESNGTYDPDDDTNDNGTIDSSETDNLIYRWTAQHGNESPVEIGKKANFNISDVNTVLGTGAFIINLTVKDNYEANASVEIEINISNVPSVANITSPKEGEIFHKFSDISLDGGASLDADNVTTDLYFYWEFTETGKTEPIIALENNSNPTIPGDLVEEGEYTITLWVDDNVGTDLFNRKHNVSAVVNITVENRAPIAKFNMLYPNDNYPNTINLGDIAYFNASKSSDPDGERDVANFTYEWDFADSSEVVESMVVNYTYKTGGKYNVTLTITDDGSEDNNTAITNLTVIINNIPVADAGEDIDELEVDEEVLLDGSGSRDDDIDDNLIYYWIFDEDAPDFNSGDPGTSPYTNVSYNLQGTFVVILNVSDGFAYATDTLEITVIKGNSPPYCYAGAEIKNVDVDHKVSFSGRNCSDPDEDTLTYKWDFGDGSAEVEGENVTHSYSYNGEFIVTLNITDSEFYADATLKVIVRPEPPEFVSLDDGDDVEKIVVITGNLKASARNITKVEIKIGSKWYDTTPVSNGDWSEWSYEWDTTEVDNNEYNIQARAVTSYATSNVRSINVNVTNAKELSITISTPASNTNVKGKVVIRGTTTGESVDKVEVQIGTGGSWVLAIDASATGDWSEWSYDWDTTGLENKVFKITVRVTAGVETKTSSISVRVNNPTGAEDEGAESSGVMELIQDNLTMIGALVGIIIILLLLAIAMVMRKNKQRRIQEKEEELEREDREREEKERLAVEKEEEERAKLIKKQPVRCPKCKEYSVIEDDGQRPLMIECVHCGSKGYITAASKHLGEPKLPAEEEEKLIIQCPKCDEMFTVEDEVGEVVCPSCGVRGHLDEETLEELRAQRELAETEPDVGPPEKTKEPETKELEEKPEKKLRCPNCDAKFNIPADATEIECPSCGATGTL